MAKVRIENLTKRFRKVVAVKNLTLDIKDKEFVVLLGPSGCGKTTTLRCVAGLETPDEGEIVIGDTLVKDLSPADRDVAMVFQSYALYPHMKVYDNLAFPLKMKKKSKQEIEGKVKKVADLLRIGELLDRKPAQLSGGQRQRVALGRAIIREPKVYLMDEPLSNLDAKLRVYMRAELKRLQQDLGTTTIYVTHDQVEAMTMADRIALMDEGVLQQYVTPSEIYKRPSNQFVAGFIGTPPINFIECSLVERNASMFLEAEGFEFELNEDMADIVQKRAKSSELVLGVRPEDMAVHRHRVEDSYGAEVFVIETLGAAFIVNVKMGENILKIQTKEALGPVGTGDKVWFSLDEDKMHIFDKVTGRTLL